MKLKIFLVGTQNLDRRRGSMSSEINVVGAVVVKEGMILCAQRGPGKALAGLWEFPGGKIEAGESGEQALLREVQEELRLEISVGRQITTTRHEYEFAIVNLTTFYCSVSSGEPQPVEHLAISWLKPQDLLDLEWAPADIPAVHIIHKDLA